MSRPVNQRKEDPLITHAAEYYIITRLATFSSECTEDWGGGRSVKQASFLFKCIGTKGGESFDATM